MTKIQKLFTAILPKRWAERMERESREWLMRCPCGHEVSVWEAGGIRWKAAGNPKRLRCCAVCGKATWHRLHKRGSPMP